MDFTAELSALQGSIVSIDHVHPFSRITSRGGNEEKIKYVIESLSRFLKNEKYINENGIEHTMISQMRKFAMYIVLNSDLKVLKDMAELEGVFLIISSIPLIPQYLMCEMLWNLHMEDFAIEIITYSYPPLAIEVAGAFADSFKYNDPTKGLQKLQKLSAGCYSLVCRLHCFEFEPEIIKNILTSCHDIIKKILKYFTNPPNSYRLDLLSKDELYEYKGHRLQSFLWLIYECFNYFTQEVNSYCFNEIYQATYKDGCFKDSPPTDKVCECQSNPVSECLTNCNIMLLDIFQEIVMDVSVDIFCAWSEFEVDGKSMQQNLGELCYKVRAKLLNVNSVAEHPVVEMIKLMAREPVIIHDIINSTDTNVIIQNINSNKDDRAQWIHALVNKEQLCQHVDLITAVESNIDMYDEKECLKLYYMFTNYSKSNTVNREIVSSVAIKLFQHCSISDKHILLKEHFSENQFHDLRDDEEFQNILTEIFNKFIASPDEDFTEVLDVFLQNPSQVFNKIFMIAQENMHLTNIMVKIMDFLKDYSNYYYVTETEPCIINIIKKFLNNTSEAETKQNNLVKFLSALKYSGIIPGTKLLLLIIMPNIHKALVHKDISMIHIQIQLLDTSYSINELLEYRAPMLAMLGQVLEVVRWKNIWSFIPNASSTLQLTLNFQKSLIETYDSIIPIKERDWLTIRLEQKNMHAQNKYNFRTILGGQHLNFFESVSGMELDKDTNRSDIIIWATQILSSSTQEEWYTLWDNLTQHFEDIDVLYIFQETLIMITKAVERIRCPTTRACLFYCMKNLVSVIRYKYFRETLTDRHVISVSFSLVKLLKEINKEDVNDIGSRLMPLFAFLVENKDFYTANVPSYFKNTNYSACDEPELKSNFNDDTFPSSDQIWGMIGTILATVACWVVYTKVRFGRKRYQDHHIPHGKPRITANARRGHM